MKELKLKFNKETVANLTGNEMKDVKGGFTYGLSGGARCQWSKRTQQIGTIQNDLDCKVRWRTTMR